MAERFYLNWPLAPGPVDLEGAEAHHLATVCRLGPGDAVCLFNGDGREYPARVVSVQRRRVTLEVGQVANPQREWPLSLEVAAPLPKGDRGHFLVEKLTELGVTAFVPLASRHSVGHPRESRLDKLQRYVIEACKQCGRNVLMQIAPLTQWETYSRREDLRGVKILAHPGNQAGAMDHAKLFAAPSSFFLAVGPEGGFTPDEVQQARSAGWHVLDLGPRILRIETAALVLAAWAIRDYQARPSGAEHPVPVLPIIP